MHSATALRVVGTGRSPRLAAADAGRARAQAAVPIPGAGASPAGAALAEVANSAAAVRPSAAAGVRRLAAALASTAYTATAIARRGAGLLIADAGATAATTHAAACAIAAAATAATRAARWIAAAPRRRAARAGVAGATRVAARRHLGRPAARIRRGAPARGSYGRVVRAAVADGRIATRPGGDLGPVSTTRCRSDARSGGDEECSRHDCPKIRRNRMLGQGHVPHDAAPLSRCGLGQTLEAIGEVVPIPS